MSDFLPRPDQLRLTRSRVKVTVELTRQSVDFFRSLSLEKRNEYRRTMAELLEWYAAHHSCRKAG